MSTSPSWFDQEKFSRLVKKVAKPAPAPEAAPAATDAPAAPPAPEPAVSSKPAPEPALPHTPASMRSMMTSQSVSLRIKPPPAVTPEPAGGIFDTDDTEIEPASTSHISLASKPLAPPSEPRSLPTLPRRTAPLPALKSLFQYEIPASRPTFPDAPPIQGSSAVTAPPSVVESFVGEEKEDDKEAAKPAPISAQSLGAIPPLGQGAGTIDDDLPAAWEKIAQLNAELNQAIRDRDQAVKEGALLREQLSQADETLKNHEEGGDPSRLTKERDDALAEGDALRNQLRQARESLPNQGGSTASGAELEQAIEERNESRREYASLRALFETWKQEQVQGKGESTGGNPALEQQLEEHRRQVEEQRLQLENQGRQIDDHRQQVEERDKQFQAQIGKLEEHRRQIDGHRQQLEDKDKQVQEYRQQLEDKDKQVQEHRQQLEDKDKQVQEHRQQLEDKDREVSAAKAASQNVEGSTETLKQEARNLQDQLAQAKEEASIAHRGLALSQKALQEMRDALREATETSARSKSDMENIKNECSTLVQQNMFLQAQHDQVSRDLSAAKAKLMSKG